MHRAPLFRAHPAAASAALVAVLALTNGRYDYHRDELYFRMLEPAWGYVDQPPLTPLLGQGALAVLGDSVWAIRFPSILCLVAVVWLGALLCRELGGGRAAQALCVWGLAFAGVALGFGHVLSTATVDLVVWVAVLLFAVKALLRDERWWPAVGLAAGIGLYNKHLVVLLLASLGMALLAVGPRRPFASKWLWIGVGLAVLVGAPNVVYQALNDWPQLEMASAIAEDKGPDARKELLPLQLVLLGPLLVPVWVAGIVALLRRPQWRPVRALAVAYPALLVVVFVSGGQMYYPIGLLAALYAAGCAPAAAWAATRGRRALVVSAVVLNAAASSVMALPILPVEVVGDSPVPAMNATVPDQIGWRAYAEQVMAAHESLPPEDAAAAIVITSNYGEAGALDRYGDFAGVYSGHNELHEYGPPPPEATVAITVGLPMERVEVHFDQCEVVARLENGVGIENEEQGRTVGVCRGPVTDWDGLWPRFQRYG